MSNEETLIDLQLECISKKNPLVAEEIVNEGTSGDKDSKSPTSKELSRPAPECLKLILKSRRLTDSTEMVATSNLQRPLTKLRAGRAGGGQKSRSSLSSPSLSLSKKFGGENPLTPPLLFDGVEDDVEKNDVDKGAVGQPDDEEEKPNISTNCQDESNTTGASSVSSVEHVTECATIWSIICFVLTSSQMIFYLIFVLTKDDLYCDFYTWVTKPISWTAMGISFALKPRRRADFGYMVFLYFQYATLTLGSEVSSIAASKTLCQGSHLSSFFGSILLHRWSI